jgi:hypothetical protein
MGDWVLVLGVRVRRPLAGYAGGGSPSAWLARGTRRGRLICRCSSSRSCAAGWRRRVLVLPGLPELGAERFIAARRARGTRLFRSPRALEPVIGHLRGLGVLPAPAAPALSPVEELLERYRRYLLIERVLTVESARVYVTAIRPFVESLEFDGRHREAGSGSAGQTSTSSSLAARRSTRLFRRPASGTARSLSPRLPSRATTSRSDLYMRTGQASPHAWP